jgi:hypothetical protein
VTFLAGQTLTAAALNSAISAASTLKARQTAQVDKTNSSFANLTGLAVAVEANKVYRCKLRALVTGANVTHDVKFQVTLPAGATIEWSMYAGNTAITANPMSIDTGTTNGAHSRGTVAGTLTYVAEGVITTAGTAGTAQVQGAQNTTDAGTCSFLVGSTFSLEEWV